MGNCQTVDAAALVIQHPSGKQERMYWSITASEVMKLNPGHYVSLIIPLSISNGERQEIHSGDKKPVQYTRVKLLRPSDTLVLGRAYRLVTTQEVMKVLKAKKHAKMKRSQSEGNLQMNLERRNTGCEAETGKFTDQKNEQVTRTDINRQRSGSTNVGVGRPKSWLPSLQSISESVS